MVGRESVVKMADLSRDIAANVFKMLNGDKVSLQRDETFSLYIVTDTEPKGLKYPEGWYYAKGSLRNKHTSSTGGYSEIYMMNSSGMFWDEKAKYCFPDYFSVK